jgi:hypothetical protein
MERERAIIGSLLLLQLVLWLGFLVHRSPRFPGSLAGGLLAVAGALLMIVPPVLYSAIKRVAFFKRLVAPKIRLATLLSWHVYTSIVGSILAILHTAHRFESNLGIALTAVMLLAVFSGFIGRHFLGYVSMELREKQDLLSRLTTEYNQLVAEASRRPEAAVVSAAAIAQGLFGRVRRNFAAGNIFGRDGNAAAARAARLAESIADVEHAIKTHELLRRRSKHWLWAHLAASLAFYLLLALHVWSAIYFGLRWFG